MYSAEGVIVPIVVIIIVVIVAFFLWEGSKDAPLSLLG